MEPSQYFIYSSTLTNISSLNLNTSSLTSIEVSLLVLQFFSGTLFNLVILFSLFCSVHRLYLSSTTPSSSSGLFAFSSSTDYCGFSGSSSTQVPVVDITLIVFTTTSLMRLFFKNAIQLFCYFGKTQC